LADISGKFSLCPFQEIFHSCHCQKANLAITHSNNVNSQSEKELLAIEAKCHEHNMLYSTSKDSTPIVRQTQREEPVVVCVPVRK
jgi:hypothetical protein